MDDIKAFPSNLRFLPATQKRALKPGAEPTPAHLGSPCCSGASSSSSSLPLYSYSVSSVKRPTGQFRPL